MDSKIQKDLKRLIVIRDAFHVQRYHTRMGPKTDTVGQHTANLIGLLFYLFDDHPPLYLIRYALHHDVPEVYTGDVPATAKWDNPELHEALNKVEGKIAERYGLMTHLDDSHKAIFKFADMMELVFHCIEVIAVGNVSYLPILRRGVKVCSDLLDKELKGDERASKLLEAALSNPYVDITPSPTMVVVKLNQGESDGTDQSNSGQPEPTKH